MDESLLPLSFGRRRERTSLTRTFSFSRQHTSSRPTAGARSTRSRRSSSRSAWPCTSPPLVLAQGARMRELTRCERLSFARRSNLEPKPARLDQGKQWNQPYSVRLDAVLSLEQEDVPERPADPATGRPPRTDGGGDRGLPPRGPDARLAGARRARHVRGAGLRLCVVGREEGGGGERRTACSFPLFLCTVSTPLFRALCV